MVKSKTEWEQEKEQSSQELKDNRLFQGLFKAVIELTQENKNLKNSIENLRDINRKPQNETSNDNNVDRKVKTNKVFSNLLTIYETNQLNREGQRVCYLCKHELSRGWINRHVFYSCDPRCASEMERIMINAVYKYWTQQEN